MAEYTQAQLERMVLQIQADGLESLRSSDVCALLFGYGDLLAKRDTLAAELVALRAGLPRWRKSPRWEMVLDTKWSGIVGHINPSEGRWCGGGPSIRVLLYDTREAAMLAVTEALGLPPCEVEGE